MPVLVASVASVALVASALTPQLVEVTTTAELATYLRASDSRLVRPSPSATTAARQKEAAVLALLPAVLQELIDTNATSVCDCDDAVADALDDADEED